MSSSVASLDTIRSRRRPAWQRVRYVNDIRQVDRLGEADRQELEAVAARYAFRSNDYYLGLIDWDDPRDPIRRLIIPRPEELDDWGALDASDEAAVTVARGVQHKYRQTVLFLCNEVCGGYCRYCFRKRLFMSGNDEVSIDMSEGLRYVADHPEVTNVLLSGGDPLLMSTGRLEQILRPLREIPHVSVIRIGTKIPAFNPWRILDDRKLCELVARYSTRRKRIYIMTHFDHPRELTEPAVKALAALRRAGAILANQCPLVAGINDNPIVLGDLFRKLAAIGTPPYYVFQGRPTVGNKPFEVPIVRGYQIFMAASRRASGLGRRARFCMSHSSGKIAVVGMDEDHIYLRYHQAKDPKDASRLMVCARDDEAHWLDQLVPADRNRGTGNGRVRSEAHRRSPPTLRPRGGRPR